MFYKISTRIQCIRTMSSSKRRSSIVSKFGALVDGKVIMHLMKVGTFHP